MRILLLALTMITNAATAPDFTHHDAGDWINSPPLALPQLHGKVVMVEFWTFDCINCHRSVPWVRSLHERFASRGLQIVGVHTPELPQERVPANVRRKVEEYGIRYPVMLDADYSTWNAWSNQYWPAFYLIDKQGHVRAEYFGETHADDERARRIERDIAALLAEPG